MNAFFLENGLLQRTADGFIPAKEVVDFMRASAWNAETAVQRLAPVIRGTWFTQELLPTLRCRPIPDNEAIQTLASKAVAGPSYRSQLDTLLDYMQITGIIARENGMVRLLQQTETTTTTTTATPQSENRDHRQLGIRPFRLLFHLAPQPGWFSSRSASRLTCRKCRIGSQIASAHFSLGLLRYSQQRERLKKWQHRHRNKTRAAGRRFREHPPGRFV